MNIEASTRTNIGDIVTYLAEGAEIFSKRTDLMGRLAKAGIPIIELVETLAEKICCGTGIKTALGNLKTRFKTVKDVTSSTNVFERGKEWGDSFERSKIFKNWQKTTSRVCLTAGQALETVSFVDKIKFGFFTNISFSLGEIPVLGTTGAALFPLTLLKDGFICVSAVMNILEQKSIRNEAVVRIGHARSHKAQWEQYKPGEEDLGNLLKKKYDNKLTAEAAKEEKNNTKFQKWWGYKQILIGNGQMILDDARKSVSRKNGEIESIKSEILDATVRLKFASTRESKALHKKRITEAENKLKIAEKKLYIEKRNELRLKKFTQFNNAIQAGRSDMVQKYNIVKNEIKEFNAILEKRKSWISIAVDIAKIFIITLAAACLAMGISKLFLATICLSVIGFISEALGITKAIYAEFCPKPKKQLDPFFYS